MRKEKGRVDVVFANAGVVDPVLLTDSTPDMYDKHFNLNARGVYFTVQKALPLLADKASIILSGSAAWQMGVPAFGAESSFGLLCPNLDRRVDQPWHSSERNQSWTDGDPHGSCRRARI